MITQLCLIEGKIALSENRLSDAYKYYQMALQANQLLQQNLQVNIDLIVSKLPSNTKVKNLEKDSQLAAKTDASGTESLAAPSNTSSTKGSRVLLIAMVKNEITIIHEWLSHVLSLFDEVHIVDHVSTDGTRELLTEFALLYPNLKLYYCDQPEYRQSEIITHITKYELRSELNDWLFFVDADEFLPFENKADFLEQMRGFSTHRVVRLPWLNLIPQNFDTENYLCRNYIKPARASTISKVAFRPALFKNVDFHLEQGNHSLIINGVRAETTYAFDLLHIPVRSFSQLSSKIRNGVAAYQAMNESGDSFGFHWFEIAKYIKNNKIGQNELNGVVFNYSKKEKIIKSISNAVLYDEGYTDYSLNISTLDPGSVIERLLKSFFIDLSHSSDESFCNKQLIIDRAGSVKTKTISAKPKAGSIAKIPKRSFNYRLMGKDYLFPDTNYTKKDVDISVNFFKDKLLSFLGTRTFSLNTYVIDYLDLPPVHTLFVADFLKNIKVVRICRDQDEVSYVKALCQLNSIDNIVALDSITAVIKLFDKAADLLSQLVFHDKEYFKKNNNNPKNILLLGCAVRDEVDRQLKSFIDRSSFAWSLFYVEGSQPQTTWQSTEPRDMCCFSENNGFVRSNFSTGAYSVKKLGLDIVVAMYNTPLYIIECVDSLISKNRADISVIIVNDGSTDESLNIVNAHYLTNPRVKIITKINGGCASARNYGRLHSEKSHITFIDSDDFSDPDMFAKLFDLSIYTGAEVTQGGFDFYDGDAKINITPSYEDALFAKYPAETFVNERVIRIKAADLIPGQPTIWRRVYRRDFLDSKNIFFPENIRAYDDYIFHSLTIYYARDIFMMPDIKLHYRQHAGQDIKQGDERHFFEIYMFKQLLRRSLNEGWADFSIFIPSMINTVNWSLQTLRQDLIKPFAIAAAKFFWCAEMVYGSRVTKSHSLSAIGDESFQRELTRLRETGKGLYTSYIWAYIESIENHPVTLSMLNVVRLAAVEEKQ